MSDRNFLFKNNPFIGLFQYSKTFDSDCIGSEILPKNNPYIGNFTHDFSLISKEIFTPTITLDKLMIYYKTLHTRYIVTRTTGTQTIETGDSFIVLNLSKNEEIQREE